jgi:hypothetical protein
MTRMQSRLFGMVLGFAAIGVLIGAMVFGLRPEAQEASVQVDDEVSATELQLYIDTYTAMQANHDLTLETVLVEKNVSLDEFRNIERRVQRQDRLVRKVREALQATAKARTDALPLPGARAANPQPK